MSTANASILAALDRAELVHAATVRAAAARMSTNDARTIELAAKSYLDAHRAHALGMASDDFLRDVADSWRRNLTRIARRSELAPGEATTLDVSLIVLRYKMRAGRPSSPPSSPASHSVRCGPVKSTTRSLTSAGGSESRIGRFEKRSSFLLTVGQMRRITYS